jgi:putative MATE family efflux protein
MGHFRFFSLCFPEGFPINNKFKEIPGMFDGPILPLTVKIGMPILIGNAMQFCYALIDTIFISRIDPSSTAIISGTGLMFPLFFVFMAISQSISIGVASLVGRLIGANDHDKSGHIMPSAAAISFAIGIPALVGGYLFDHYFLHILAGSQLSEEAIEYGHRFFNYFLPGLSIMLVGSVFIGILQGEGHTSTIARAMVVSTLLNIILDPILIFGFKMGVAGAGLATSISILSSALLMFIAFLRDKSSFPLSFNIFKSQWNLMAEIIRIGFPTFLSMGALAISFMVLNKVVSAIDQTSMNAWTLVGRMDQIVLIPSFAVAGAALTMIAQNYGRKNFYRVGKIYRRTMLFGMLMVFAAAIVYAAAAPLFFRLFSDVKEVVSLATIQVRTLSFTFIGLSAAIVSASTFQALGRPFPALFLAIIRMGLISIPLALILVFGLHMKIAGVFIAVGTGNLCALPLAYLWVRKTIKKLAASDPFGSAQGPDLSVAQGPDVPVIENVP